MIHSQLTLAAVVQESGAPLEESEALYTSILERAEVGLELRACPSVLGGIEESRLEALQWLKGIRETWGPNPAQGL